PASSNYFLEIAKYRSARRLWSMIVQAYQPSDQPSAAMVQRGSTSLWSLSIYDPYTNLLRTTTQAMSAILGGVDTLRIHTLDAPFFTDSPFSRRMARNIQYLLRH